MDAIYQEYRDEPIFPQTIVDTGNNINPGILGKERAGMLIMANPGAVMLNIPQIRQDQHAIGSRITLNHQTLQNLEHLSNIDENLEAMIWPILFPYGKGSFKRIKNASYDIARMQDYVF